MTGVGTEPGGTYSSGAPGLTSILEVHVFTQFCHIECQTELRSRNTTLALLYFIAVSIIFQPYETSQKKNGEECCKKKQKWTCFRKERC